MPNAITAAQVTLSADNEPIAVNEIPLGSGLYYTDSFRAVINKIYKLTIEYDNQLYTASAIQQRGQPFEPISYTLVSDSLYTLNFVPSGSDPNYINYQLDWQLMYDCPNSNDCRAELYYYDLKNVDVHEQFKPDQERVDFPAGTIIIRRKFSVSDAYRDYLRGILSETAWRGGVFDIYPANAPTNISGGAVGFFAVCTVVSDTVIVAP